MYLALSIGSKFEYSRHFREFIIRYMESGVFRYYKTILELRNQDKAIKLNNKIEKVGFEHIYIIFYGFNALFIFTVSILLVEIVIHRFKW